MPTQAFAEFFRFLYKDSEGQHLDGIAYRSSKNLDGINYVLFAGNEHCCDKGKESPTGFMAVEPWLVLESVQGSDPAKVYKEHKLKVKAKSRRRLGGIKA